MKGTSRKGKGRRIINCIMLKEQGARHKGEQRRGTVSTKRERTEEAGNRKEGDNGEGERKDSKAMQVKLQSRRSFIELPMAIPRDLCMWHELIQHAGP